MMLWRFGVCFSLSLWPSTLSLRRQSPSSPMDCTWGTSQSSRRAWAPFSDSSISWAWVCRGRHLRSCCRPQGTRDTSPTCHRRPCRTRSIWQEWSLLVAVGCLLCAPTWNGSPPLSFQPLPSRLFSVFSSSLQTSKRNQIWKIFWLRLT